MAWSPGPHGSTSVWSWLSRRLWSPLPRRRHPGPDPVPHPLLDLIVLQLLFLVCDSAKTPLTSRQTKWSPSSAATLAAVVLLGPLAAALVGATSLLSLRRQLLLAERLFNGAMHALCRAGRRARPTSRCTARSGSRSRRNSGSSSPRSPPPQPCTCWPTTALIWGVYRLNRGSGHAAARGRWSPACRCCWPPTLATRAWAWSSPRSGRSWAGSRRCSCWCRCSSPAGPWGSSPSSSVPTRRP